jgi:hypothetical protein
MRFDNGAPFAEATFCRARRHVFDHPRGAATFRGEGPHPYVEAQFGDGGRLLTAKVANPETGEALMELRDGTAATGPVWAFHADIEPLAACPRGTVRHVILPYPNGLSSGKFFRNLTRPVEVHCRGAERAFRALMLWPNGKPMMHEKTFYFPNGARAMEVDRIGEASENGMDLRALRCWKRSGEQRQCRRDEAYEWTHRGIWPVRNYSKRVEYIPHGYRWG